MTSPRHPPAPDLDPRTRWLLPLGAYYDPQWFSGLVQRVLERSWHGLPTVSSALPEGSAAPCTLLPGSLDEPAVLTRDADGLHLLSNVCPHRGAAVVERVGPAEILRCGLHGRTFSPAGRVRSAPGLDTTPGFPRACDHLAPLPWAQWGPLLFGALRPHASATEWLAPLHEHLAFALEPSLEPVAALSRDYDLPYSWLPCCETELDLAHAPHVHDDQTAASTGHGRGRLHLHPWGALRSVDAAPGEPALALPPSHPRHGSRLASLHLWLFPGTFVSAFPWGLRARMVLPLGPTRTHLVVLGFAPDPSQLDPTLAAAFDRAEHEDQRRLASVTRGLGARHAPQPRYAPSGDEGLRWLHRMLLDRLAEP